jgi:hypothetical protein
MTAFRSMSVSNQSALGATAVRIDVPRIVEASARGPLDNSGARHAPEVIVFNMHSSQLVYAAFDRTATATDYDIIVGPSGQAPRAWRIPVHATYLSVIASGASTPTSVIFGESK